MELTTGRLRLREFDPGDRAAVHAYAADPEFCRYLGWGPNTAAETAAFLRQAARDAHARPRTRFALAITDRATDRVIGSLELRVVSRAARRGEIGYGVAPAHQGHGYATEAAAAIMAYGFRVLELHKIAATCDPENSASARVLTRLGMRREGYLRHHLYVRGEWRDRLLFAAFAE